MKNFLKYFSLVNVVFLLSLTCIYGSNHLPQCPKNTDSKYYDNCLGSSFHYHGEERHDYYGEWKNGKENGLGVFTSSDGDTYFGSFKNGVQHGLGSYTYPDGRKTIGQWRDGYSDGWLLYTDPSGDALFAYETKDEDFDYNSNVHDVFPTLKSAFYKYNLEQRKTLQKALKHYNFYEGTIDGVWGRNTLNAFAEFSIIHLQSINFNTETLIKGLIDFPSRGKKNHHEQAADNSEDDQIVKASSGTGFFVSSDGIIVTNNHVIKGCSSVAVGVENETFKAMVIAKDIDNDLAILSIEKQKTNALPLANNSPQLLQDIYASGYPFGSSFSSSIKVTKGIVSSLTGLSNNYSQIQIDAAIQPGNSGGPIVDNNGNVVGVAVSKLDVKKVLKNYGVIPENVNFGVKVGTLKNLLESNNIRTERPNKRKISKTKLGDSLTKATVFLSCYMTMANVRKMRTQKALFPELEK